RKTSFSSGPVPPAARMRSSCDFCSAPATRIESARFCNSAICRGATIQAMLQVGACVARKTDTTGINPVARLTESRRWFWNVAHGQRQHDPGPAVKEHFETDQKTDHP